MFKESFYKNLAREKENEVGILQGHVKNCELDIKELKAKITKLENDHYVAITKLENDHYLEVVKLKNEKNFAERTTDLKVQEAVESLRKEMKQSLINSDLLRTEALAKLSVYEKLDTKADANVIKETVKNLIDVIGRQNSNFTVVK